MAYSFRCHSMAQCIQCHLMDSFSTGDTLFIILRKQQLIFLHWYHHITVFIYVWYSYVHHTAPGQWFLVMNYTVHALMYTYYAFRSMKFKISKWVSDFLILFSLYRSYLKMVVFRCKHDFNWRVTMLRVDALTTKCILD